MTDRSHRAVSVLAIVLLGAVVVVSIVGVSVWMGRERPGARSLEDALRDFRNGDAGAIDALGAVARRPQAGVYAATGAGHASIDIPPVSQSYGATIPVTVRHIGDDCWSTRVDFNTAYAQTWDYCLVDGQVVENANHTSTRWDFGFTTIEERTEFVCSPPSVIVRSGERRNDGSSSTCTGSNSSIGGSTTSAVTITMLGAEPIDVGGTVVAAFHFREDDRLTGAQRGTTAIDYWYSVESFLLLRMERSNQLRTDSPIGSVTYAEDGALQLSSLEPAR